MKSVPFDVVKIYSNRCTYTPYALKPVDEYSVVVYAIKIGNDYFPLGERGRGVYLCDYEYEEEK